MEPLAALTNLQCLKVLWNSDGLSPGLDALVPLTALTQLTRLDCWHLNSINVTDVTLADLCDKVSIACQAFR